MTHSSSIGFSLASQRARSSAASGTTCSCVSLAAQRHRRADVLVVVVLAGPRGHFRGEVVDHLLHVGRQLVPFLVIHHRREGHHHGRIVGDELQRFRQLEVLQHFARSHGAVDDPGLHRLRHFRHGHADRRGAQRLQHRHAGAGGTQFHAVEVGGVAHRRLALDEARLGGEHRDHLEALVFLGIEFLGHLPQRAARHGGIGETRPAAPRPRSAGSGPDHRRASQARCRPRPCATPSYMSLAPAGCRRERSAPRPCRWSAWSSCSAQCVIWRGGKGPGRGEEGVGQVDLGGLHRQRQRHAEQARRQRNEHPGDRFATIHGYLISHFC